MSGATSQSLSSGSSSTRTSEPYREAADYIYTESNYIFNKGTLIINARGGTVTKGWIDYYITRLHRRDPLNVVSQDEIKPDEILQYDRIYMVYVSKGPSSALQTVLNENYKLQTDNKAEKVRVYVRK